MTTGVWVTLACFACLVLGAAAGWFLRALYDSDQPLC